MWLILVMPWLSSWLVSLLWVNTSNPGSVKARSDQSCPLCSTPLVHRTHARRMLRRSSLCNQKYNHIVYNHLFWCSQSCTRTFPHCNVLQHRNLPSNENVTWSSGAQFSVILANSSKRCKSSIVLCNYYVLCRPELVWIWALFLICSRIDKMNKKVKETEKIIRFSGECNENGKPHSRIPIISRS